MGAHRGLLDEPPALLAAAKGEGGAIGTPPACVMAVVLPRVQVLGWLAHAHPEALVSLLGVDITEGGAAVTAHRSLSR